MATDNTQSFFEDSLISFSHDVYQNIGGSGSVCASPHSIISALLLLMVGTRGTSKTQIRSAVLKNNWNDDLIYQQYQTLSGKVFSVTKNELYVATKLFVRKGLTITKNVDNIAKTYFNADIGNKDFSNAQQSAMDINSYVANRTINKINDLVRSSWLGTSTVMVLVNAVYFKGTWATQFNPINTTKHNFYHTERSQIKVDMMAMQHNVRYYSGIDYSVVALPYKGGAYEMVIVLPKRMDGLQDLKSSFSPAMTGFINSNFVNTSVLIKLPKFTFESEIDLKTLLPKLGVSNIFSPGIADFSNLVQQIPNGNIYVSEARHKVVIDVNESGTEAAAGTAVDTTFSSPSFIADHPFLFYIQHGLTGSILFIGHYKPS